MSFSIEILKAVRADAVTKVLEANAQIADIDQTLALLDGATAAPAKSEHYNHVHAVSTDGGELQYNNGGDVHIHGAAAATNETGAPEAVLTPDQVDASGDLFPPAPVPADEPKRVVPRGPLGDHDDSDELTFTAPPAPEPKTGGRRTNEEIAAEIGVNLEDVKEWKGGGRISRADMEEFKKLHAGAAIPGQQTIDDVGAPEPDVEAAPDMWSESDTSGGEADAANLPRRVEQAPPSYGTADEAVVADDAETFEPPF